VLVACVDLASAVSRHAPDIGKLAVLDGHIRAHPGNTDVLLGSMERCITSLKRLRGQLPTGTPVKDKTGTISGTANDVGTLPNDRGRVVIGVHIKKGQKPLREREHVIAEIARSVYDYMFIESVGR
jgi:beta-lactamase class A